MSERLKRLNMELLKLERVHEIWFIKFSARCDAYRTKMVAAYGEDKVKEWESRV